MEAAWLGTVTPVRVPQPLPIYQARSSWLPYAIGVGHLVPPAADPALATYVVLDDLVVAPELERYIIVRWGERLFPSPDDYVGNNHDYTSFLPLNGHNEADGVLWMNHEYVSFPFLGASPGTPASLVTPAAATAFAAVLGFSVPDDAANLQTISNTLSANMCDITCQANYWNC